MQSQELENVGMPLFHRLLAKMTKIEKNNKFDFFCYDYKVGGYYFY